MTLKTVKKIGFIGIGNMGYPMALNLHKAGFEVEVFDLSEASLKAAKSDGLACASSAHQAATSKDMIVSMLPAGKHVEALYLGAEGLLTLLKSKKESPIVVDCSTIAAENALRVSAQAKELGIEFLDAPVSGGTGGAAAGTLSFMVGGQASTLGSAKPALEKMGKNIFHAGPSGSGQVAKACNNMLLAIHMIGTSEALALGVKHGMKAEVLSEIMSKSSGANWSLEVYNPFPGVQEGSAATRGYTGGFASALMLKDLGLARDAAANSGVDTPLGKVALDLYKSHCEAGMDNLDFSSIIKSIIKEGA